MGAMTNTAIRLSDEELGLVDAMVERLAEAPEFRGLTLTRSEVLRMAIARGLDQLVEQYGDPRESRGRSGARQRKKRR